MDPIGTPVGIRIGGRGWSERHVLLLEGETTELQFDTAGKQATYAWLDPEGGWTRPLPKGLVVLEGVGLESATPAAGSEVEFGGNQISLRFDAPLAPVSTAALELLWTAPRANVHLPVLREAHLSDDGKTLTLKTAAWLPERTYAVPLKGLLDSHGLPVRPTAYGFDVLPSKDRTAPEIIASTPATGVELDAPGGALSLSITFDETMHRGQAIKGSGVRDIEARGYTYPELESFGVWDEDYRTITWSAVGLEAGKTYALPIRNGSFRDLSRNSCGEFDLIFTVTSVD